MYQGGEDAHQADQPSETRCLKPARIGQYFSGPVRKGSPQSPVPQVEGSRVCSQASCIQGMSYLCPP